MLYPHNDIFLTDIIGCDQLKSVKFIPPNEILGTPAPLWVAHDKALYKYTVYLL